jgi:hypothetical protein
MEEDSREPRGELETKIYRVTRTYYTIDWQREGPNDSLGVDLDEFQLVQFRNAEEVRIRIESRDRLPAKEER